MKDDRLYLLHIVSCIDKIKKYTGGDRDLFFSDEKTQDSVLRNLQTLAESTKNLSIGLKSDHPEIDWRNIAGFRNILVHDYLGTDLEQIWDIVEKDIPDLEQKIKSILK